MPGMRCRVIIVGQRRVRGSQAHDVIIGEHGEGCFVRVLTFVTVIRRPSRRASARDHRAMRLSGSTVRSSAVSS